MQPTRKVPLKARPLVNEEMNWRNPPLPPPPIFSEESVQIKEVEITSPSVSDQRTLYLVNIFILHTARFLNRFSALCNEKLAEVHRRMRQLDASLVLLEAQVSRIGDWIDEFEPEHNVILQGAGPSSELLSRNSSSVESSSKPFRYEFQGDHSEIGEETFSYDPVWFTSWMRCNLEFWLGEREASFVPKEDLEMPDLSVCFCLSYQHDNTTRDSSTSSNA